jgi:hypothetical protein
LNMYLTLARLPLTVNCKKKVSALIGLCRRHGYIIKDIGGSGHKSARLFGTNSIITKIFQPVQFTLTPTRPIFHKWMFGEALSNLSRPGGFFRIHRGCACTLVFSQRHICPSCFACKSKNSS